MLRGLSVIGFETGAEQQEKLFAFSTILGKPLPEAFSVASKEEINQALLLAEAAFPVFSALPGTRRAEFLEAIAENIAALGDDLIQRAHLESGLPLPRLSGERDRTVNQLKLFAAVLREGSWVEAVIDTALPDRQPLPRADLRKMLVPLGPVAVFAASNFPFAFSTAGGDTAAALASGCPVILKAHSSHLGTNELIAGAIQKAAIATGMPEGVFSALNGEGAALGQQLARHASIKAIGFTGSYRAGMSLFRTASNDRATPIPVYAEMSSINPVMLLPETLKQNGTAIAKQLAGSITLGVGQFCTNPGLILLLKDETSQQFITALTAALEAVPPATMLNKGICAAYYQAKKKTGSIAGVKILIEKPDEGDAFKGSAALLQVDAADFIKQPELQEEIFGPASLVILCDDHSAMEAALASLHGQLTGSLYGTDGDLQEFAPAMALLSSKVGRLIYNNVPTGVEVCHAMVHGGPFPATTDGRSTSVGADAIKRFVRPVCLQDCPATLLPAALQDSNPLNIMRKLNGQYTRESPAK
ncbi:aldehyde dehydrogenase (NADP(+)) [Flavihumibacter petaseus]|nr:aldehyde dehydrogenase (NADP(+)) [Flavihumibacter petaseus]